MKTFNAAAAIEKQKQEINEYDESKDTNTPEPDDPKDTDTSEETDESNKQNNIQTKKEVQVVFYTDPDLKENMVLFAEFHGITIKQLINGLVSNYLEVHKGDIEAQRRKKQNQDPADMFKVFK